MAGYTRQSSFVDGDTITADLFNDEYNQLVNAFNNSTGHSHDGTSAEGPVIGLIGDAGETSPNNKVLIDTSNNYIEFYVEVSSAPVQQLYIADGAIIPVTDNDIDLGTSSLEFKNLYLDGTATIDTLTVDEAATVGTTLGVTGATTLSSTLGVTGATTLSSTLGVTGATTLSSTLAVTGTSTLTGNVTTTNDLTVGGNLTVTGNATISGNLTFGDADTDSITLTADVASHITPDVDDTYDLGTSTKQWRNLYIDGTAEIDTLSLDGTAVTSTAAELNILDGVTSTATELNVMDGDTAATSTTLADADRVVVNDAGVMKQVALTDFETYFESALDTLSNVTTVGALNAGSITSGFGSIDNGSSAITTTGTITYGNLSDGTITITGFVDEDTMVSDSATLVPTQQSVKAYVDSQVTAQDLDFQGDSGGALSIDLDSETLTIAGGTGIDTTGATNTLTVAIDSTVATLTGTQTLTNKTLTTPIISSISNTGTLTLPTSTDTLVGRATTDTLTNKTLTSPVINTGVSGTAVLDDDTFATASSTTLATSESIKAYVDAQILTEDTLAEMNDVNITTPADGSLLFYDTGTSMWIDNVVSGDITIADTGVAAISSGVIVNDDINASAAISVSKTALVDGTGLTLTGDTLSVDASQTQITAVGTIGTGTWQGTAIADAYVADNLTISGGTVDNSVIGGSTPAAGTFTTLTANTSITGTLATAAQTNITSVGTLSSLTVSGDATFDTSTLKVDSTNNRVGIGNATPDVSLDIGSNTDAVHLPTGTTAQRPGTPAAGYFRYNSEVGQFEGYTTEWGQIGGGGGSNTFTTDTFTGDGSTVNFTLSQSIADENNLVVFNGGVFQNQSAYSVSGTTLTFDTAPANTNTIVVYSVASAVSGNNLNLDQFTGDGSTTGFTLSISPVNENNTQVFIDGVYQQKDGYTVSGTTLTFSAAPPNTSTVEVMTFTQTDINTAKLLIDADEDTKIQVEESTDEDKIRFDTGGTERMIIDSTGVGIGTSSPSDKLEVVGDAIRITDNAPTIRFSENDTTDTNYQIRLEAGKLRFQTNNDSFGSADDKVIVDENGNVLINTTTIPTGVLGNKQVVLSSVGAEFIAYNPINAISSGDRIGAFVFGNDDNSGTEDHFAGMWAKANGTIGHMDIHFAAGRDLYEADTPQMTLDKDGNVGIGTSSPTGVLTSYKSSNSDPVLGHFYNDNGGTATEAVVYITNSSTTSDGLFLEATGTAFTTAGGFVQDGVIIGSGSGASGGLSIMTRANADMRFYTNGHTNERMRIDSSGDLLINSTSATGAEKVHIAFNRASEWGLVIANTSSTAPSNATMVDFRYAGTQTGSIGSDGTNTSYNTSSDYRLKENIIDMDSAITRVKSLQPKRFNFIANPDNTVDGFLAHEVSEVIPEAITGEKDAVNEDGTIKAQGIDQSKIVPLLTGALKEAIAKIEDLESRIQTLEGN